MGALLKALERPSSYSMNATGRWETLCGMVELCMFEEQLAEFEAWAELNKDSWPGAWDEPLTDRIALRREEIAAEDVGAILRDRFDFK